MNTGKKLKELPLSERPYEKCIQFGPQNLSDAQLLAVILRTGTRGSSSVALAEQVLNLSKCNEGLLGLHHLSIKQFMSISGIGKVKAIQLKCIGELSKRLSMKLARPQLSFENPCTIADYYMESLRHEEQENMVCMFFDTKNHLLGEEVVFRGTVNSSLVSPREIFLLAFGYHAVHILLVHNHPSGDATPSKEDILTTKRLLEAGNLIGIQLLDHIIIGDHEYTSLRETQKM